MIGNERAAFCQVFTATVFFEQCSFDEGPSSGAVKAGGSLQSLLQPQVFGSSRKAAWEAVYVCRLAHPTIAPLVQLLFPNNTQALLSSVKWPEMFGEQTQVSGPGSVCAWPVVCVCFLCNGLQLSVATQPELIGFQWARVEAHPSILLVVLD